VLVVDTDGPEMQMEDNARLGSALRLARNLCAGIAAFYMAPTGEMRLSLSSAMSAPDLAERTGALARACLEHPGAQGTEPFYTAEPMEEAGNPDDALACVAIQVRRAGAPMGVLGVVDTWLPDLDQQQLQGLHQLAELLANFLSGRAAPEVYVAAGGPAPEAPEVPEVPVVDAPTPATAPIGADVPDRSDAFIRAVAEGLPDGVMVVREDGTIVFANDELVRLTGRAREQILGIEVTELVAAGSPGVDAPGWTAHDDIQSLLTPPAAEGRVLRGTGPGGDTSVELTTTAVAVPSVGRSFVVVIRPAPSPAATSGRPPAFAEALLDAMEDGVVLADFSGSVLDANARAVELLGGGARTEMVGRHFASALELLGLDGVPITWGEHPLAGALAGREIPPTRVMVDRSGERRHLIVAARPLPLNAGNGAVVTLRDVTADVEEEQRLTELALRDPLTGLGNRHLLREHLERTLRNARDPRTSSGVILLDLDGFKEVNDQYGHAIGDDVLVLIARRIEHSLRATEVVARFGGDEFVVACDQVAHGEVEMMAERLKKALASPIRVAEHTLSVGASVGWATADRRVDTAESLIARADAEMYRHKASRAGAVRS